MPRGKWAFQQDNDSKHIFKIVNNLFIFQNDQDLEWEIQSPDLNPIEM